MVAGDVSLGRLSDFVRQFSSSGFGGSALLTRDYRVLARSDMPGVQHRLEASTGVLDELHRHMVDDGTAGSQVDTAFSFSYQGSASWRRPRASRPPAGSW